MALQKSPSSVYTLFQSSKVSRTHLRFFASFRARFFPAPPISLRSTGFRLRSFFKFLLGLGSSSIQGSTLHPEDFMTLAILKENSLAGQLARKLSVSLGPLRDARPEIGTVFKSEIGDGRSGSACSSSPSDSMYVGSNRLREVCWGDIQHMALNASTTSIPSKPTIVDHDLDALEIETSSHQLCHDQHPQFALSEFSHDLFPLRLALLSMDSPDPHAVHDKLLVELVCTLDGLHEDEDGGGEFPRGNVVSQCEQLAHLGTTELEVLRDGRAWCIPDIRTSQLITREMNRAGTDDSLQSHHYPYAIVLEPGPRKGLWSSFHGGTQHDLLCPGMRMAVDDGLDLGQEVGSDQTIGFVEN
jgi:hypothetical protein